MNHTNQKLNEIYVANLDEEINEQILYNSFNSYGYILSVKVMRHIITKKSRGFGFVTYKNRNSVDRAIQEMDNTVIFKNKIRVYSKEKYKQLNKEANVFFSKLPKSFKQDDLQKLCEEIGEVFSIKFIDQENEEFNQAYVQFEVIENSQRALQFLDGKEIAGINIVVSTASKKSIVYLRGKNTPTILTELKEVFEPWGEVTFSELFVDDDKKEYTISVRFTSEQKAKAFIADYKDKKQQYDFIKQVEHYDNHRDIYKNFRRKNDNLFLKISPFSKTADVKQIEMMIKSKGIDIKQCSIDEENGETTLTLIFNNPQTLQSFIIELENKNHFLYSYVEGQSPVVNYPNFLIKIIKKQKMQAMGQFFNPLQQQQQMSMGMMGMPQVPGMPMMPGVLNMQQGIPLQMQQGNFQKNNPYNKNKEQNFNNPQPNLTGKGIHFFKNIQILEDNRKEFDNLSMSDQQTVLKSLFKEHLKKMPDLIDPMNLDLTEKVLQILTEQDLLNKDEQIDSLRNQAQLREFVNEALETLNQQHEQKNIIKTFIFFQLLFFINIFNPKIQE